MQGQGSSVGPFPEAFGFEHGSSSSTSAMDPLWNNMVLTSLEPQHLPDYLISPADADLSHVTSNQEGPVVSIWSSGETSSSDPLLNNGACNGVQMGHLLPYSSPVVAGSGLRMEERHLEAGTTFSLENVDIDLNTNANGLSFRQSSSLNDGFQNPEQNDGHVAINTEVSELSLCPHPFSSFSLVSGHDPSSNAYGNSSGNLRLISEDIDGKPGNLLDGKRLACKRKNVEGVQGQSSACGSALNQNDNYLHNYASSSYDPASSSNISTPLNYVAAPTSTEEQFPIPGNYAREVASEGNEPGSAAGNAGSSRRNFRLRTNSAQQHEIPPTLWSSANTFRHLSLWNHPSSYCHSFDQSLEAVPTVTSSTRIVPGLPQSAHRFVHDGASSSRAGIPFGSVNIRNRNISTTVETSERNTANTFHDFSYPSDIMQLMQDPTDWNMRSQSTNISAYSSASLASSSSLSNPVTSFTSSSHQNSPTLYHRMLPEVIGRLSRVVIHSHPPPRSRPALLLDQHGDGVLGVPLNIRSREGGRMISEIDLIRNALEFMRRERRLEPIYYGGIDMHDRHRDMRLDTDNMSYEELLALEDRIGNVSTGLSEESILKLLKQRKFTSSTVKAPIEEEPCCICQEEYVDGEDLGILDCGHDFHPYCIKQWLMHKNSCPICKNTALVT